MLADGEVGFSMPKTIYLRRKICLLGDAAVGKTSVIRRFVRDIFDDHYVVTLGTKVTMKELDIKSPEKKQPVNITIMIWDILGQKELKRLQTSFYKGASGALIVADITRKETLESVDDWILSLFDSVGKIPVLILLNKSDLREQTAIKHKEIMDLVNKYDTTFLFTSAKTGENVDKAFTIISKMLVQNYERKNGSKKRSKSEGTSLSMGSEAKVPQKMKISNISKSSESV